MKTLPRLMPWLNSLRSFSPVAAVTCSDLVVLCFTSAPFDAFAAQHFQRLGATFFSIPTGRSIMMNERSTHSEPYRTCRSKTCVKILARLRVCKYGVGGRPFQIPDIGWYNGGTIGDHLRDGRSGLLLPRPQGA